MYLEHLYAVRIVTCFVARSIEFKYNLSNNELCGGFRIRRCSFTALANLLTPLLLLDDAMAARCSSGAISVDFQLFIVIITLAGANT